MAQKIVRKFYNDFKGLNLGATHLKRAANEAIEFTNVEITQRGDVTGRKGFKPAAQFKQETAHTHACRYPVWGTVPYNYSDITSGEIKQELVGIGNGMFKLTKGSLSVVYTGASTATFSFLPASGGWVADLKVGGVSQAGFPMDCGRSSTPTPATLATLRNAINSIANFSCFLTPAAVVDGNQVAGYTAMGTGGWGFTPLTVHNAIAATTQTNTITTSSTKQNRVELYDRASSGRQFYDVVSSSGTSVGVRPVNSAYQVNDLDEIGVGIYPVLLLPITEPTSCKTTPLVLEFTYWERVYQPGYVGYVHNELNSFFMPDARMFEADAHNYSMVNNSNCLYVGMPFPVGTDLDSYTYDWGSGAVTEKFTVPPRASGLMKYDGQSVYAAGLPRVSYMKLALAAGAGLSVGTYKYLTRLKSVDERGNITYSTDTLEWTKTTPSILTTAGNQRVQLQLQNIPPMPGSLGFAAGNTNSAVISAVSAGNTISVLGVDAIYGYYTPTLRVGDTIRLLDRGLTPVAMVERKVTSVSYPTPTTCSVTFSGGAVTVAIADYVSTGCTIEIFRTKVGGSAYYLVDEVPIASGIPSATYFSYVDTKADTALGYQYDGPFTGARRKDLPPIMAILENHQGLLVGAGDPLAPDTVYWSNDDSSECFPLQNSSDASNTRSGPITALASDNVDNLAIFKEDAYFNLVGDLIYGGLSTSDSGHGDIGCPSHFGIVKIRSYLLFISNKGPRMLKDGQFLPADERLAEIFNGNIYVQTNGEAISSQDQAKRVLRRVSSWHDADSQRVYFYLPTESGTVGSDGSMQPNTPISISYDYSNDALLTWSPTLKAYHNMSGGGGLSGGKYYFQGRSVYGGVLYEVCNTGTKYDYQDDTYPIVQDFAPQWDFLMAPCLDKYPNEMRIYCLFGDSAFAAPDPLIPHTLKVGFYKNFIGSVSYGDRAISVTTVPDDGAFSFRLPLSKIRSFQPRLRVDGLFECMRISGYEVLYSLPYKEEDLVP